MNRKIEYTELLSKIKILYERFYFVNFIWNFLNGYLKYHNSCFIKCALKILDQYKMYIKFNMKNSCYDSYKIKYLANK